MKLRGYRPRGTSCDWWPYRKDHWWQRVTCVILGHYPFWEGSWKGGYCARCGRKVGPGPEYLNEFL